MEEQQGEMGTSGRSEKYGQQHGKNWEGEGSK